MKVPIHVIRTKCQNYMRHGKAVHRTERTHHSAFSTISQYQQEYKGIVEYYRLAYNLHRFNRLKWIMEQSLTKTLAHKFRITVSKVYDRFGVTVKTPDGSRKILMVEVYREKGRHPLVARWGGISLKRQRNITLNDQPTTVWNCRTELLECLLADTCELCGSQEKIEVHHIRHLKDLRKRGQTERPEWIKTMAARNRKTLIVCQKCHNDIHAGRIGQKPHSEI
ncbi:group II intron reverse transcriptase/maturase [Bacillus cereus]|uniref:Domain X domain-containing protein n=1 Tax=Bacillus cereus TaxID=1396 RepID=A0AA44Q5H7_BACCE|nr:group II intron reverse transcriptase/maturase [Bacillus cereus]PFN07720.1 hypothetical protein COJ55_09530 [Bacillus cereus]PFR87593.1 hypothetical protein COK38_26030 [Bacillus cereus]